MQDNKIEKNDDENLKKSSSINQDIYLLILSFILLALIVSTVVFGTWPAILISAIFLGSIGCTFGSLLGYIENYVNDKPIFNGHYNTLFGIGVAVAGTIIGSLILPGIGSIIGLGTGIFVALIPSVTLLINWLFDNVDEPLEIEEVADFQENKSAPDNNYNYSITKLPEASYGSLFRIPIIIPSKESVYMNNLRVKA